MKKSADTDNISDSLLGEAQALRFFSTNSDHKFLLDNEHELSTLTGQMFTVVKTDEPQEGGDDDENKDIQGKRIYFDHEDSQLKSVLADNHEFKELFIPEVLANDSIKFWRVPQLGSM